MSSLLLTNARLIDGTGATPRESCSIRIRGGRIEEIGDDIAFGDETVLDAEGGTILPGLIDAHVHLQAVPGATYREDDEEERRQAWKHHLRAYLGCGVTTILDAAIAAPVLREIRCHLDSGGVGPRVLALAPAFYPPDGYLDNNYLTDAWKPIWRPAGTRDDVCALFEEYDGIKNIVGVKFMVEYGFSPFYDWPIHSAEMRGHINQEAAAREMPVFVHAIQHRAHLIAMEMEPRALMHTGFIDREPSDELIARMRASGTYIVTTLSSLYDCLLERRTFLKGIEDPLILSTVPRSQVATVQDMQAWKDMWRRMIRTMMPGWVPDGMITVQSWFFKPSLAEVFLRRGFRRACRAIMVLHQAGVPVVMGTDAGAWPMFPSCFHGYSTIREMELLVGAGLDPMTVIEASTRVPAGMLGLENEIGTVQVGKRADLVVLSGDPLADLSALRSIRWTIRDGEARTPSEWMEGGS